MFIHSWTKTPRAAAQIMLVPNFAVIQGQRMSSPDPIANPIITAPGPVNRHRLVLRGGISASRMGAIGNVMRLFPKYELFRDYPELRTYAIYVASGFVID